MRRFITISIALGLIVGSVATAQAAKKKPVKTTLYMHGTQPIGEAQLVDTLQSVQGMTMTATEPAAGAPKSQFFGHPAGNEECAGNPFYPSWDGRVTGTVVGDLKVTVYFVAAPATINARLWEDVAFSSCTSSNTGATDYVPPISETMVEVPAGANEVEFTFENVKMAVLANLVVQMHTTTPNPGRLLYDAPDYATRIEFDCIPKSGSSCTP